MYRRTSTVSFRLIEDKVLRIHDIPELVLFAFESPWDDLFSTVWCLYSHAKARKWSAKGK